VVSFTARPLYPGQRAPGIQWIGGWVDPRAGLHDLEKRNFLALPELELRPLGRPARSQLLYRLSYPGCVGLKLIQHRCYEIIFRWLFYKTLRPSRGLRHSLRVALQQTARQHISEFLNLGNLEFSPQPNALSM
jgi:hypothetical protein